MIGRGIAIALLVCAIGYDCIAVAIVHTVWEVVWCAVMAGVALYCLLRVLSSPAPRRDSDRFDAL